MKRKILPLFLSICLLGGCANAEPSSVPPASEPTAEPLGELTREPTEPDVSDEVSQPEEKLTLRSTSLVQLEDALLNFTNDFLRDYMEGSSSRLGDHEFTREGEWALTLTDGLNVRMSTRKAAVSDEEQEGFRREVSDSEYITLDQAGEQSAYGHFWGKEWSYDVEKVSVDGENVTVDVADAESGYTASGYVNINAFVARNDAGEITFIPDPAYMHGIPVIAKNPGHLTFDINGTEVMMDSFAITGKECRAADFPEVFGERGTEYFYAKVKFNDLDVNYDFVNGYQCSAEVDGIEFVTDDVISALNKTFVMDDPDKDPAMAETYNAIINNLDTICKDSTHGIILLDMDFDGTPELLVSDVFDLGTERYNNVGVNVLVYRIGGGELKYIDSFPSANIVVYNPYNSLGLKTLPDGSKGWFSTSYDETDSVYQLKGDELVKTEIFRKEAVSETVNEYGTTETEYNYYFMGELIEPTVIHEDISEVEGPASDTHLEWRGAYSYWGEMWELVGKIRENYCADITESYRLYNDWLSPFTNQNNYEMLDHYSLTDRELSYNIAYLVDSYYLGDYSAESYSYEYRFLGDYAKPVIYLYPERETEVSVKIELPEDGELTCTYPDYGDGWNVTALPDGTLYDRNGNEYYCLYWEGSGSALLEGGRGWCVAGDASAEFLREKLTEIGLTAREANEFIIYWLPELQKSAYNVITFHTEDYARGIPLTVSPAPDSVIRVFMTFEPSDGFVDIAPQNLPHYERTGSTLVEWGGSRLQDGSRVE